MMENFFGHQKEEMFHRQEVTDTKTFIAELKDYISWYNRPHSALEHQTSEEYEQSYYDLQIGSLPDDATHKTAASNPGRFTCKNLTRRR